MTPDNMYKQLDYLAQQLGDIEDQMAEQIDPRAFGQLEGAVKSLTDKVADLTRDVEALTGQVGRLVTVMSEAKGGWRAVVLIGGVAATLGGFAMWVVQQWAAHRV